MAPQRRGAFFSGLFDAGSGRVDRLVALVQLLPETGDWSLPCDFGRLLTSVARNKVLVVEKHARATCSP